MRGGAHSGIDLGTSPLSLTERWVSALLEGTRAPVPMEEERVLVRQLLDFFVCTLGGGVQSALASTRRQFRMPTGRLHPSEEFTATLAEGLAVAAHRRDRDDLHWPTLTHPGGVIWPTVLAIGAERDASGRQGLAAARLGYQAMISLALALGPSHRERWHATTTAGTVGAGLAAAWLMSEAPDLATRAAGNAISVMGGSAMFLREHSQTGLLHRAHAVLSGIRAARFAERGFSSTLGGLETEGGALTTFSRAARPEFLEEPWQAPWWRQVACRCHPASGYAQTAIQATLGLLPVDVADVSRIVVEVPAQFLRVTTPGVPVSDDQAWWSIPYSVASCLVLSRPGMPSVADASGAAAVALMRRTEVVPRPSQAPGDITARVTLELRTGHTLRSEASNHLGHPDRPPDFEDLAVKWAQMRPDVGADSLAGLKGLSRSAAAWSVRRWVRSLGRLAGPPLASPGPGGGGAVAQSASLRSDLGA